MLVSNDIPAFSGQLSLFSIRFPLRWELWNAEPLFSTIFPRCSFIFEESFFSFPPENGLAVHLKKGSLPGSWPCLGRSREWIAGSAWHWSIAFPGGHDRLHGFNLL
jgi:hypothetical protein